MKISLLLRIFGVFLVFTTAALAQNQKPTVEDEQVLFNVTVTTKKSDWIIGLKSENFKVYDEKNLQPITFFSSEDVPISVGILVDKSQSTDGILAPAIRQALSKFVNKSHSDDEYFLMTFNVTQELLLDNIQDKNAVLQAIEKLPTIKSQGNTSYYDAIRVGLEKVSKGKYTHKVLIILSDGMNNESKIDFGDIKKIIKQSDVLLYNINLTNSSDAGYSFGMQALAFSEELVGLSGGKIYNPQTIAELNEALVRTAEELRNQYVIGFKKQKIAEKDKKEKWHEVEIKVELPANLSNVGKVNVRNRKGYYLSAKSN